MCKKNNTPLQDSMCVVVFRITWKPAFDDAFSYIHIYPVTCALSLFKLHLSTHTHKEKLFMFEHNDNF